MHVLIKTTTVARVSLVFVQLVNYLFDSMSSFLLIFFAIVHFIKSIDAFSTTMSSSVKLMTVRQEQPEMQSCYAIRRSVFIEEQQVPPEIEMDDKDATATHVLATLEDGTAVGAARIVYVDGGECDGNNEDKNVTVGKIGRVSVLKEHRGNGYGRQIVLFAVDEIRKSLGSGGVAKLGSQVHAIQFYESMDFTLIEGEQYMDAGGVPHRDMKLIL